MSNLKGYANTLPAPKIGIYQCLWTVLVSLYLSIPVERATGIGWSLPQKEVRTPWGKGGTVSDLVDRYFHLLPISAQLKRECHSMATQLFRDKPFWTRRVVFSSRQTVKIPTLGILFKYSFNSVGQCDRSTDQPIINWRTWKKISSRRNSRRKQEHTIVVMNPTIAGAPYSIYNDAKRK